MNTAPHWLRAFCTWLDQTALSQAIQVAGWVVPTVQTIHILSIALVIVSALMIDLRLVGLVAVDQPLERVTARFLPFVWWPLLALLATGAIMIIGEPARSLENPVFQLKMSLLVGALIVTGIVGLIARTSRSRATASGPSIGTYAVVALSLLLWTGIIFAGRWIAYWA
jgi:hypothetical protein